MIFEANCKFKFQNKNQKLEIKAGGKCRWKLKKSKIPLVPEHTKHLRVVQGISDDEIQVHVPPGFRIRRRGKTLNSNARLP